MKTRQVPTSYGIHLCWSYASCKMFESRSLANVNLRITELRSMKLKKVEGTTEYAIKIKWSMWADSAVVCVAGLWVLELNI